MESWKSSGRESEYPGARGTVGAGAVDSSQFPIDIFEFDPASRLVSFKDGWSWRYKDASTEWDDYEFPMTSVQKNPATSKPDFDFANVLVLFDGGSTETVVGLGHLPHSWKIGSSIYPHVHWIQEDAGVVKWQLEYKLFDNNSLCPASFTTITTVSVVFTYASGALGQISYFPAIDCSALTGVSPNLIVRLSRLGGDAADTYSGDAKTLKFDFHFEKDSFGSREEYIK